LKEDVKFSAGIRNKLLSLGEEKIANLEAVCKDWTIYKNQTLHHSLTREQFQNQITIIEHSRRDYLRI